MQGGHKRRARRAGYSNRVEHGHTQQRRGGSLAELTRMVRLQFDSGQVPTTTMVISTFTYLKQSPMSSISTHGPETSALAGRDVPP
jgi:hypothetical protein